MYNNEQVFHLTKRTFVCVRDQNPKDNTYIYIHYIYVLYIIIFVSEYNKMLRGYDVIALTHDCSVYILLKLIHIIVVQMMNVHKV